MFLPAALSLRMRYFLLILLLILISVLTAAEIRNGQLWLEVFITEDKAIEVHTNGTISIQEIGSPVSVSYNSKITLKPDAPAEQVMWGLINRTEIIAPDEYDPASDDFILEKFVWQDGKLAIQYEKPVFEDRYFPSREAAEKYALETGYSTKQIASIPLQNSRLKVIDSDKKQRFFQMPVYLNCSEPVLFGESEYEGTFIIKSKHSSLVVTDLIDLESYIAGVIPNEIGNLAPTEALRMQAVAARTHAVSLLLQNKHINDGYDLCNKTHCQVYKGNHLKTTQVDEAVLDTKDIVMTFENRICNAVYHSNCGGKTDGNQHVWFGKPIPYLQSVACHPELDSLDLSIEKSAIEWINSKTDSDGMTSWERRSENWDKTLSRDKLAQNNKVKNLQSMVVLKRGDSGRIMKLKLVGSNEVTIEGEYKIRQGFGNLPSSFFYIKNGKKISEQKYSLPSSILIRGRGFGHGVGLCQVGALRKARDGWNWQDILSFYYPGLELTTEWLRIPNNKK